MNSVQRFMNRLRGRHSFDEEFESLPLRAKYRSLGVQVGLYSYGCFDLTRVPSGVTVGRYCSFSPTAFIFLRDHGLEYLGLTAYFYNATLGVVDRDMIELATLDVADDVWLGHNSIILSQVRRIGRGAAIAAGAVVTREVPPYAIVAGNPAKIIRMRFDDATISAIEATRWWELNPQDLLQLATEKPELVFRPNSYFRNS